MKAPVNAIVGNGRILASMLETGAITSLTYPNLDYAQNVGEIGIAIYYGEPAKGWLSWVGNEGWTREQRYLDKTNKTGWNTIFTGLCERRLYVNKLVKHQLLAGIAVILVIGLLLASCAPKPAPASAPAPAAPAQPIKLRYTTSQTATHHMGKEMKYFADELQKRTAGRVKVETYFSEELYDAYGTVDALVSGIVEMALSSVGYWAGRNPVGELSNLFFVNSLGKEDQYQRVLDGLSKVWEPYFEKNNVKIIHWLYYGDLALTTKVLVEKPADLKGLRVRPSTKGAMPGLEALGASPVELALAETYDAMAKGALDGITSGWSAFYVRKWYEVSKYYVGPISSQTWPCLMSLNTWNRLPKDIQDTILGLGKETQALSWKQGQAFDTESINILKQHGTVKILTPQETAVWTAAVKPASDIYVAQAEKKGFGKEAREVLKVFAEAK